MAEPIKKALITGITGQDGSYLAELLLSKGYEVHGIVRRVAHEDPIQRHWRIRATMDRITVHPGSLENYASVFSVVEKIKPDECYHLAAQSFVGESFDDPFTVMDININGTLFILSALRERAPECRFYFAGSSEMFGKVRETPQNEQTPFHPRSPYGISKVTGFELTRNFREAYNMFATCGILFNHESERRGMEFVTRKISSGVAAIKLGKQDKLYLGNLDAKRDWGYAPEYVHAMWLMLQQDIPDDYVIATGKTHTVREFVEAAFKTVGLDWQKYVEIDDRFKRPAEVDLLVGDNSKAQKELGWQPKVDFMELASRMVTYDKERLGGE